MRIGKYHTQAIGRLKWIFNVDDWRQYPRPTWFYPADNWIDDPAGIEAAIRMDEDFEIKGQLKEDQ